jgi:hypothetical protein
MRRIVEHHLARLRAQQAADELDAMLALLYPTAPGRLRCVRTRRVPAEASDRAFEDALRRSGLWVMMERCYPSANAQSQ